MLRTGGGHSAQSNAVSKLWTAGDQPTLENFYVVF